MSEDDTNSEDKQIESTGIGCSTLFPDDEPLSGLATVPTASDIIHQSKPLGLSEGIIRGSIGSSIRPLSASELLTSEFSGLSSSVSVLSNVMCSTDGLMGGIVERTRPDYGSMADIATKSQDSRAMGPPSDIFSRPNTETQQESESHEITWEDIQNADIEFEHFISIGLDHGFAVICSQCEVCFLRDNAHRLADLDPDHQGDTFVCGRCRDADRDVQ